MGNLWFPRRFRVLRVLSKTSLEVRTRSSENTWLLLARSLSDFFCLAFSDRLTKSRAVLACGRYPMIQIPHIQSISIDACPVFSPSLLWRAKWPPPRKKSNCTDSSTIPVRCLESLGTAASPPRALPHIRMQRIVLFRDLRQRKVSISAAKRVQGEVHTPPS